MTLSVADRLDLTELASRYAVCVDARDFDGVAALFTEDGVLVSPEHGELDPTVEAVGRDGVHATMAQLAGLSRTFHEVAGVVLDPIDDVTARGKVTCVAHHVTQRKGEWTDLTWHLRYEDRYRRTPEGWLISRRVLRIDLIETRPLRRVRPQLEES